MTQKIRLCENLIIICTPTNELIFGHKFELVCPNRGRVDKELFSFFMLW
jgi:hypothetical protein